MTTKTPPSPANFYNLKLKAFLDKARSETVKVLDKPIVKAVINVGGATLDTIKFLEEANLTAGPLSAAGFALSMVSRLQDQLRVGVKFHKVIKEYFQEAGLVPLYEYEDSAQVLVSCANLCSKLGLYKNQIKNNYKIETILAYDSILSNKSPDPNSDTSYSLKCLTFGNNKTFYSVVSAEGKLASEEYPFSLGPNTTVMDFLDFIWGFYDRECYITYDRDLRNLNIQDYKTPENDQVSAEIDPSTFIDRHNKYVSRRINRAHLLVGPPGTGKTTFCLRLSKEMNKKTLFIHPEVLDECDRTHLSNIIEYFQPSLVIFEDIDRVSYTDNLLFLIDRIRNLSHMPLVISTANHLSQIVDALQRPGRLGTIKIFGAPKLEARKKIVEFYCNKLGVTQDISDLVPLMDHPKFTHDYLKEVCEQALFESKDNIKKYIVKTISLFEDNENYEDIEDSLHVTEDDVEENSNSDGLVLVDEEKSSTGKKTSKSKVKAITYKEKALDRRHPKK